VASHGAQAAPAVPQAARVGGKTQAAPTQQPKGQLLSSQMQLPRRQRCPAAQASPPPQVHSPLCEQPSAMVASQARQALPAPPHWASE